MYLIKQIFVYSAKTETTRLYYVIFFTTFRWKSRRGMFVKDILLYTKNFVCIKIVNLYCSPDNTKIKIFAMIFIIAVANLVLSCIIKINVITRIKMSNISSNC